ncbi:hypothetical protein JMF89_10580 [Clostridiaceae bacterium UIB06]|uniref:Uncharacterized protein n=1 Tax=Clostridium thailandense TaxID=2794346 RepID=A0A949WUQ0_9CLOT|nr:hypothetical protein [Clostridium thailandense]MBV7272812.1 hypothetical protein [Clostridium thailandense]MCH5137647.1 hypothetical protein [Clostridiaceae bacterium UIB06]
MTNQKYDYYLIKQKDGRVLKFCYDSHQGISYQILMKRSWSEKISIYKTCLEYFCVLEEWNGKIHVFCQDICGDLILCTLKETEWKYKILLHMKYDVITPIYISAFFHLDDIHLLYNIVDNHTYSEVLIHQIVKNGIQKSCPQIITQLDYCSKFSYCISQDSKSNLVLLNTMLVEGYQLISKTFHIIEGRWGKEEVIYTSLLPYIDFTFCVEENRDHYLFITQDNKFNRLIYQYKEIGLQKNTVLFQHKKIDSCLLILSNKVLWALWICEDKLYGCFSTNYGQNFSITRVYRHFDKRLPVKIFYQEYSSDNQDKYTYHEIYALNQNGEEQLFLHESLEDLVAIGVDDNKSLKMEVENVDYDVEKSGDSFTKLKMLEIEKEELQQKLRSSKEESRRLNKAIEYEKEEMSKLKYQFYKEKEKIKLYTDENSKLKDKISYLEQKLLLKDKEKIIIERNLIESKKETESLKQQLDLLKIHNLPASKEASKKSPNESPKQSKFSLIRWLFDDENN